MITELQERLDEPTYQQNEKERTLVQERKGLCVNCEHAPDCMHRKVAHQPVLHCEEYELSRAMQPTPPKNAESRITASSSPAETIRLKGLCMNCEHRDTCTFPKPEGGVWHCEEYR